MNDLALLDAEEVARRLSIVDAADALEAALSAGLEGVDGSSPSEGFAKAPQIALVVQTDLLQSQRAVGMEPFMELSSQERPRPRALFCLRLDPTRRQASGG